MEADVSSQIDSLRKEGESHISSDDDNDIHAELDQIAFEEIDEIRKPKAIVLFAEEKKRLRVTVSNW